MVYGVRWLISNYSQTWLNGTCLISFDTDRPVHVWLRWTEKPPLMHLQSLVRRGLGVMKDPYYCFTVYQDIEQNEAGDTLHHTFSWPSWYDCLTRWFLFWGTTGGVKTPTQWGIFSKHYTGPSVHTMLPVANADYVWVQYPTDKTNHYLLCQQQDTVYEPPSPEHGWGWFEGNFVWTRIYDGPQGDGDYFLFPGLPPEVKQILKVSIIILVGKLYVYGRCRTLLKTHGSYHSTDPIAIGGPGLVEYFAEYDDNPWSLAPWTVDEVNSVEAGVWLEHKGTFGRAICDQVRIEVTHRPA